MDLTTRDRALNLSIVDGALSAIMGSLCGGMFLVGYAIKILNASAAQIGILASLPLFASLSQIFGAYLIEKYGETKKLCFMSVIASRILWLLIIMLPLAMFSALLDWRVWILIAVIAFSSIFGSLAGISWLAWMSELAPEKVRGTYFGKRSMIAAACGMVVVLLAGKFLSLWESRFAQDNPFGFIIIFAFGLFIGLIATWFLFHVPEPDVAQKKKSFDLSLFLNPLKDRNYLVLIIFVSAWMFSFQIAAPFYGVYMIENLQVDFSSITIFLTLATLTSLFMMKIWGPMSDRLGNKPIVIVSGWILVLIPFIWITALPGNYFIPVVVAHILSGAFIAGVTLSLFNIVIKLSPREGRSAYLAMFAAITGVVSGIAPVLGGGLSEFFKRFSFVLLTYNISNLHMIFILSSVLQAATIFFVLQVKEPKAAAPVAVIMQLQNDLNPQTGIGSATDFIMVKLEKTEGILKKVDRITDELAAKSEQKIGKALEKGEKIIKKPLDRIKDLLKDEEEKP